MLQESNVTVFPSYGGDLLRIREKPGMLDFHVTGLMFRPNDVVASRQCISALGEFSQLNELTMAVTENTLYDTVTFPSLPSLRRLDVSINSCISDYDMYVISCKCRNLDILKVSVTGVTDAGLVEVGKLQHLTELDTSCTKTTGIWIKDALFRRNIKKLRMGGTGLTDDIVSDLLECPDIEVLDVSDCRITGKSITTLRQLKKLRELNLFRTNIKEVEKAELRTALPACEVF